MKFFNLPSVRKKSFWGIMLFALAFQACEDHRLPPAQEELPDQMFYALTDNNTIYELNVRNTTNVIRTLTVSEGLVDNDKLVGIDFRPATGQLYAIGKNSRLYNINLNNVSKPGLATPIGSMPFGPAITASSIAFDFNPTVDRIRFVTNAGQNLRLHPETGALAVTDGNLNGVPNPMVGAVAYTNSFSGTTSTGLYDIDPVANKLYFQKDPNGGVLEEVGSLGMDIADVGGFDIAPWKTPAGKEYAIASVLFDNKWELDFVDLGTGKLQKLGDLPSGNIIGIAIPSPVAYALSTDNKLLIFNPLSSNISVIEKTIGGLPSGVSIEGIDFRPADATIYALGNDSKLYTINILTGAATFKSTLSTMLSGGMDASYGVDFNPFADRLRVVSNTGQNLRIDVTTGATTVDGALNIATVSQGVNGAAYTNSNVGLTAGTQTVLFDIDSQTNKLYRQDPPNAGGLVNIGDLGVVIDKANGFDIGGISGKGHALLTVGGSTGLYMINLSTGAATKTSNFPKAAKGFALGFNL
ncbi:DUF4394 domain-containing protein [Dyadobacter sp. CY312]|uniref:DUF4394 domain-containing protein n=1 Tax=Dyadobacter sp. CY312 TaxID=2907303 RepID=UPI001F1C902D|nr:DUF4394 domain-containing protein [Dyadobacter sp. CY312]MCE7043729.1 DUF4394 domain-containing protein [Dyadobacter sp. CY312]